MNGLGRAVFVLIPLLLPSLLASAQTRDVSPFDPQGAWDATVLEQPVNQYRTGSGHPGPAYWQNHVDYSIRATLDTASKTIEGTVELTYTNHSPAPLQSLWLYVASPGSSASPERGGTGNRRFDINRVAVKKNGETTAPATHLTDRRLQVRLDQPVKPNGQTATLEIDYALSLTHPGLPTRAYTQDGVIYEIGHWFPRVAAYDDRWGWSGGTGRSVGSPLAAYGSFDYRITVPASMIVAGSGTLMNPDDVLTDNQQRRLLRARDSDRKVAIVTPDEAGTPDIRPRQEGQLTWHFRMNGVRNVAWAASPAFVWNAVQIPRRDKRPALAMSYYPPSSVGGEAWNRSTYHVKRSIRFFSKNAYQYPWNTAINVAGPVGNRGFPGLSFCDHSASGYVLFSCTARDQAQNWFPVMVPGNEERHPWMVEGFTTFLSVLAHRQLYDGEFSPKRDQHYAPRGTEPVQAIRSSLATGEASPILTHPRFLPPERYSSLYSFKTAFGLTLLRDYVLGPERFDYAFRQFVNRWAFRQPSPADFFRAMNDATGEDLSWFWKGWFAKTWAIDQKIADVSYVDENPENGSLITLELRGRLPMPVVLKVVEADGTSHRIRRPVDIWQRGPTHTVRVHTDARLNTVVLDPENQLPDVTPANDRWSSAHSVSVKQ